MKKVKSIIIQYWHTWLLTALCLFLLCIPHTPAFAALSMTTSIDELDAWDSVLAGTLREGSADQISDSYSTIVYIEVAMIEAVAHDGVDVIVEISYADDNWMELVSFKGTVETVGTTTINDASANAGDTTITLTDATTADFDVVGRKWFIKDGTIGNSESVKTKSESTNTVTLCQDLMRSHANSLNVYDRVDEWCVKIPFGAAWVRVLINNTDADCDVASTTRISKVTSLQ